MTTPNIQAAKDRLNKSIANQQQLRKRIARNSSELSGDVEEPEDANVEIESAPVDRDVGLDAGRNN